MNEKTTDETCVEETEGLAELGVVSEETKGAPGVGKTDGGFGVIYT